MTAHRHTTHEFEHDEEAAPGLPEPLPTGERVLWQGRPDPAMLARRAFHLRGLLGYFGALAALVTAARWPEGPEAALSGLGIAVLLGASAVAIVLVIARLSARTTLYTVTDRRVVMRIGIVLTVTFNLPLRRIEAAALSRAPGPGDCGDIALTLERGNRIAWLHLWPHARPWRVSRPEPMLRAIPDAARVAAMLQQAWLTAREAAGSATAPSTPAATPASVPVAVAASVPAAVPASARLGGLRQPLATPH